MTSFFGMNSVLYFQETSLHRMACEYIALSDCLSFDDQKIMLEFIRAIRLIPHRVFYNIVCVMCCLGNPSNK